MYRCTNALTAIHLKLGWVLTGPVAIEDSSKYCTNLVTTHILCIGAKPDLLSNQLRPFWELESLGLQLSETAMHENPESNIEFKGGRYEVFFP